MKKMYYLAIMMMLIIMGCSKEPVVPDGNQPSPPNDTTVNRPKDTVWVEHNFDLSAVPNMEIHAITADYESISTDADSVIRIIKKFDTFEAFRKFFVIGDTAVFWKKYGFFTSIGLNVSGCDFCTLLYFPSTGQPVEKGNVKKINRLYWRFQWGEWGK